MKLNFQLKPSHKLILHILQENGGEIRYDVLSKAIDAINLADSDFAGFVRLMGNTTYFSPMVVLGEIRHCSTPTDRQMLKSAVWGKLGRYEKDACHLYRQTGAG